MKRILLTLACLAALGGQAFAANCTNPIAAKDGAGTSMNFNTTVDGSNNCTSNVMPGASLTTLTVWNSGTAGATTQSVMGANAGSPAVLVQLVQSSGTFSAGAITFQGTYDGTNWTAIPDAQLLSPNTLANAGTTLGIYTLFTNTNKPFLILTQGYQGIRINLSTAITGTGTVSPFVALLSTNPALGALLNPLAQNSPTTVIGGVAVSQTTPGTSNGVAIVGVNAATALAGNGVTGTGSQRVTIASDNTPFATKVDQTTPGTTNNVSISALPRVARNFPGATVGTSSAQALAASTATMFLQIQNTHASNTVACAFGATAVLNSSTSVQLAAGQSASWGPNTAGVPTGALNCIASGATTPLYVEWL